MYEVLGMFRVHSRNKFFNFIFILYDLPSKVIYTRHKTCIINNQHRKFFILRCAGILRLFSESDNKYELKELSCAGNKYF